MQDAISHSSEDKKNAKEYLEKLQLAVKQCDTESEKSEGEKKLNDHHRAVLAQVLLQQMAMD